MSIQVLNPKIQCFVSKSSLVSECPVIVKVHQKALVINRNDPCKGNEVSDKINVVSQKGLRN